MSLKADFDIRKKYPLNQFQLDVRSFNKMIGGKWYRYMGLFYRSRKFKGTPGRTLLRYSKKKDTPDWRPILDRQGRHIRRRVA